jgi:hypothetical protein
MLLGMNVAASTTREGTASGGVSGDFATNLTNLLVTYPNPPEQKGGQRVRTAQGLEGAAVHDFECYTESHTHTDGGVSVTQVPDVLVGDKLTIGSTTYMVQETGLWGETSGFGVTRYIYMDVDK